MGEASFAIPIDVALYVLDNPPPDDQLNGYIQRREDDVLSALMVTKVKLEPPSLLFDGEPGEQEWIRQYQAHGLFLSVAEFDAQPAPPSGVLTYFVRDVRALIETQPEKIAALQRYYEAEALERAAA